MWDKIKCALGLHDGELLDERDDPFIGKQGHRRTEVCVRCGSYRRILGHNDDRLFVLPWIRSSQ